MSPFLYGLYKFAKYAVYPFTWLVVLAIAAVALAFRRPTTRRLWGLRALTLSILLIVVLLGNPLVATTLVGLIEQRAPTFEATGPAAPQFAAIVVLGGGVLGKGTLRPSHQLQPLSLERTLCGADLYLQGFAPRLLLTGGDPLLFGEGPAEAVEMKTLARRLGVPEDAIMLDTESLTTYDNAVQSRRLLGASSVLVVTSASHLPRALALFRKQGMTPTGYPCGYLTKDGAPERWDGNPFDLLPTVDALHRSTTAITEVVGTFVYRLIGEL